MKGTRVILVRDSLNEYETLFIDGSIASSNHKINIEDVLIELQNRQMIELDILDLNP